MWGFSDGARRFPFLRVRACALVSAPFPEAPDKSGNYIWDLAQDYHFTLILAFSPSREKE